MRAFKKAKARRGDAPGLCCLRGGKFLFEGEGEVENLVAYGEAQGEFAGPGVASVPEFAGGFLAGGEIGGFEGDGADGGGGGIVAEGEVVLGGIAPVGDCGNLRGVTTV